MCDTDGLQYRSAAERLGMRPKKGLLLYGPSGCSKTLAAKAVATEMRFNFFAVKGGEILNMYVGESERAIREIFRRARNASPSIIFFDEIDSIALSRSNSQPGGTQVVTTLLNEIDGIESLNDVFILAATNRPEALDLALLRPGRIECLEYVGLPDYDTRLGILQLRTSTMDVENGIDLAKLAQAFKGHSGAEIVTICELAANLTLKDEIETGSRQQTSEDHFKRAMAKVAKQVQPEKIAEYEAWGKQYGGTN